MREIDHSQLSEYLQATDLNILVVCAPNYEPRSIAGIRELLNDLEPVHRRIRCGILTMQGSLSRVEPLEYLKRENIAGLKEFLGNHEVGPFYQNTIPYPDGYTTQIVWSSIDAFAAQLRRPFILIVDISSLPRRVILDLLDYSCELVRRGNIRSFYIVYSWPEGYPQPRYPHEIGELKTMREQRRLSEVVKESDFVEAIVLLGEQGFQAQQFIEVLPENKHVTLYVFMNRNNPLYSYDVIRANTSLLYDRPLVTDYYLTFPSGHNKLVNWARDIPLEPRGAYLIAPFGPRFMMVSAALALKRIEARIAKAQSTHRSKADLVLFTGHQYATIYSLGYRRASVFECLVEELTELE